MPAQQQKVDKEKTRPQIPALPPGTQLDLSLPKITAPDVPPFTLPAELSMAANEAAIKSPAELLPEDWMIVARNSGLLYAYTMEDFDTEAYDANTLISPPKAVLPVLDWVVPARTNFMRPDFLDADVSSALTFTEETASYVRSGFDSESASGSYPGCAASFERDHKEREAESSLEKNLHMIGRWHFPRATLDLRFCTAVSPNFVAAVRNAVTAGKPEALKEVFGNYGVAVPRDVQLGGTQSFLHQQSVRGREWEKTVENTIKAAVSVKLGDLNANSGTAIQTGTSESTTAKSIAETSQFRVHGGDATEIGTPSAWASSVKKARPVAGDRRKRLALGPRFAGPGSAQEGARSMEQNSARRLDTGRPAGGNALGKDGFGRLPHGDVTPVSHPAGTGIRRSSNTRDGCPSKSSFITHRAAYWMGDCHPSRECGRSML